MPFAGRNWDTVDGFNRLPYTYDFSRRVAQDDVIAAATWVLEVVPTAAYPGTDATAQTRIVASEYAGASATAWLDLLTPGCRYRLTAFVETANGLHDDLWAYVQCDAAPGDAPLG